MTTAPGTAASRARPTSPEVNELRERQRRNLLTTLLVSQGVPMLLAGDELGRTQHGNNNAYAQDNEISWLDWEQIDEDLLGFTRRLIELRRSNPVLHRRRFLTGLPAPGAELPDVAWFTCHGVEMTPSDWDNGTTCVSVWLNGELEEVGPQGQAVAGTTLLLGFNLASDAVSWTLPERRWGRAWRVVVDTASVAVPGPTSVPPRRGSNSPGAASWCSRRTTRAERNRAGQLRCVQPLRRALHRPSG